MSKIIHYPIEFNSKNIKFIALYIQLKDDSIHKAKFSLNQLKQLLK